MRLRRLGAGLSEHASLLFHAGRPIPGGEGSLGLAGVRDRRPGLRRRAVREHGEIQCGRLAFAPYMIHDRRMLAAPVMRLLVRTLAKNDNPSNARLHISLLGYWAMPRI